MILIYRRHRKRKQILSLAIFCYACRRPQVNYTHTIVCGYFYNDFIILLLIPIYYISNVTINAFFDFFFTSRCEAFVLGKIVVGIIYDEKLLFFPSKITFLHVNDSSFIFFLFCISGYFRINVGTKTLYYKPIALLQNMDNNLFTLTNVPNNKIIIFEYLRELNINLIHFIRNII